MNLLNETKEKMKECGYQPSDILFIGSRESGHSCTWDEFVRMADREYDDGFGRHEVAIDLEIIFNDGGVMMRREYDGSEWWECISPFKPIPKKPIKTLFVKYECTLADVN